MPKTVLSVTITLAALALLACGTTSGDIAPADPKPSPDPIESATPAAATVTEEGDTPSEPPVMAPSAWMDADALPPGATHRLDSRKHLAIFGSQIAVNDAGTIATTYDSLGVLEIRLDGYTRRVGIQGTRGQLRYRAGGELAATTSTHGFTGIPAKAVALACGSSDDAMSPDGRLVVCLMRGDATTVRVLEVDTGKLRWERTLDHSAAEWAVGNSGAVAVSDRDKALWRYDGAAVSKMDGRFESLAFNPKGELIAERDNHGESSLAWFGKDGQKLRQTPKLSFAVVRTIAPHPDQKTLLVSGYDEQGYAIKRVDASTGKVLSSWAFTSYEYDIDISPSGRFVAVVGSGGEVLVLDLEKTGAEEVARTARPFDDVLSMVSTRSGDRMVLSRTEGMIQIFDMRTHTEVARAQVPEAISRNIPLAFSPDESAFVAANAYGALTILDTKTAKVRCKHENAPATWLYWIGKRIVAVDVGSMPDDWPYAGSVTILDPKCRQVARHDNPGAAYAFDVGPQGLEIGFDDGNVDRDGERVRVLRVGLPAGTLTQVREISANEIRGATLGVSEIAASPNAEGEEEQQMSVDGRTIAVLSLTEDNHYKLRCEDAETRDILAQHDLPPEIYPTFAIAGDGSWMTVNDRASTLVYNCR